MDQQTIKAQAIELIENNKISTTEIGDVLGKTGQIEGVYPLNRQKFCVGEVVCIYAINNSNYEVHKQVAELDLKGKILFVYNVNCDKAIFGDLVAKYILLYKRAKAIVINGIMRDIPDLIKESRPIWLSGVSPIGCVNRPNGPDIDSELYKEIKEKYEGSIMVCDDSGVVMIPKEKINEKLIAKLNFIEYQEDIWYYCMDTLKMSTYDIVCKKEYLKDDILDKKRLEQLAQFQKESDWGK